MRANASSAASVALAYRADVALDQQLRQLLMQKLDLLADPNFIDLARVALKKPHLSGEGSLIRAKDENDKFKVKEEANTGIDFRVMGAGVLIICAFFVLGGLLEKVVGIPGPVMMILAAVVFKYMRVLPEKLEKGAQSFYKLVSAAFIWPVMIGLGMLYVPLDSVVKVFSVGYVLVCISVVVSMTVAGFLIGNLMKMYPIESAIVTCCHSGLGGTGDVAILSASNRMSNRASPASSSGS